MSKMNMMETIVLDLMDTPQGVKIMEFQGAGESGFGGYYRAYNNDNLMHKIMDYYKPDPDMAFWVHHPLLKHICNNKNAMGAFVTQYAPHLFPKQKVYAFGNNEYSADTILQDFPNTQAFVFKEPEKFSGRGVFIISREELERPRKKYNISQFFKEEASEYPRSGLFLAQEAVIPKPVDHPYGLGGGKSLPTIRIVVTICPRPQGEIEFVFHGGYYKFPKVPLASAQSDLKISSKTEFQLKSNCHEGGSAKIDEDDYKNICDQIEKGLSPFFRMLIDEDHNRIVVERMMSDDLGERATSAMFALKSQKNKRPYDFISNAIQNLATDDPCFDLLLRKPRLWEFNKHPYQPV